jgi:hypothetical protein
MLDEDEVSRVRRLGEDYWGSVGEGGENDG